MRCSKNTASPEGTVLRRGAGDVLLGYREHLVVNSYMLDLLPRADIAEALGEFRRVLRPGGRLVLSNMTKGRRPWHRLYDSLYARGLSLTANCRGVLAVPVVAELGFVEIRRDYLTQPLVPTEILTARKPQDDLAHPEVGQ